MEVTIPLPPSVNHLYRFAVIKGRPIMYVTKKGKDWFEDCAGIVKQQTTPTMPLKGPVIVQVTLYTARMKRDIDNVNKALLDLLTKTNIIEDDQWVMRLEMHKIKVPKVKEEKVVLKVALLDSNNVD